MVELLIVIAIIPLVVSAITFALIAVFSLQNGTSNRLADSSDAQVVSATFERDVQSSSMITTDGSIASRCGANGTQLLGLSWGPVASPTTISYDEVGTSSPYSLVRDYCAPGSLTPSGNTISSFNLPRSQAAPYFSCSASQAKCNESAAAGWISTQGVSDVTFAVDETGTSSSESFAYSLVATPRLYNSNPPNSGTLGVPLYPLTLLGTGGNCATPVLDMTGASTVTAISSSGTLLPIKINSACAKAVTMIPGQTLDGGGNTGVSAIITADPNTTVPGSDTYCVLANKKQSACDPSQVGPPESPPDSGSPSDPLSALVPPSIPTLPGSCLNTACPQGEEFTAAQTWNSPPTPTFTAGLTYIFDQTVTISKAVTVNFAAGTYWFKGGLNMAQSTVNFGTGTYLFGVTGSPALCPSSTCLQKTNGGTITTSPSGVLFFVQTGAVTFNGSSQVSMTGLAAYGGTAIWDVSTSPLSITNGAAATDAFGGIYCPNGEVIISGSGDMTMTFVEANTASLTGSGALTIGQ